jgi:hypothetical protein
MRLRQRSIRSRGLVLALVPLLALIGLYALVATVTAVVPLGGGTT